MKGVLAHVIAHHGDSGVGIPVLLSNSQGEVNVTLNTLERLCAAFGVTVRELFER